MKRQTKKWISTIVIILVGCCLLYMIGIFILWYLINSGYTNATSSTIAFETVTPTVIPASNIQVHDYLAQHPEDRQAVYEAYGYLNGTWDNLTGRFPPDVADDVGFSFILDGIETRKVFFDTVKKEAEKLWIDYQLVLSSLLWEQIRIASKGLRGDLKDIILHSTPTLFRSYNVSLGVGGIKISTAKKVARDAKRYGYGDIFWATSGQDLTALLTTSDYWQAIYPTYLVKNILTRWQLSGYDISHNPGVVGTLYNMGNSEDKIPHKNPQIWWSVIPIGNHKYVYWWISMWIYWYLKIYK